MWVARRSVVVLVAVVVVVTVVVAYVVVVSCRCCVGGCGAGFPTWWYVRSDPNRNILHFL